MQKVMIWGSEHPLKQQQATFRRGKRSLAQFLTPILCTTALLGSSLSEPHFQSSLCVLPPVICCGFSRWQSPAYKTITLLLCFSRLLWLPAPPGWDSNQELEAGAAQDSAAQPKHGSRKLARGAIREQNEWKWLLKKRQWANWCYYPALAGFRLFGSEPEGWGWFLSLFDCLQPSGPIKQFHLFHPAFAKQTCSSPSGNSYPPRKGVSPQHHLISDHTHD